MTSMIETNQIKTHVLTLLEYQISDARNRIKESPVKSSFTNYKIVSLETRKDKIKNKITVELEFE